MLSTKKLVGNFNEVPSTWIFEKYCPSLAEKLSGQDVKMTSLFNPKDSNPSMSIYWDAAREEYRFKDFSSGKGGSAIEFVKEWKGLDFSRAVTMIMEDYNQYKLKNGDYLNNDFQVQDRYKVDRYDIGTWKIRDQEFWTKFYIGSSCLKEHFVKPLDSFRMVKEENGTQKEINVKGANIYGYFTKEGKLYKIYRPFFTEKKFIKVANYIQGVDQLKGYDYLTIGSSQKDIMSLKFLPLQMDYVAGDSENVLIPKDKIEAWKEEYKHIFALLDNDEPGIKAMKKYRTEYGITPILLPLAKDASDSMRDFGPGKVRARLVPIFNSKIE